MNSYVAVEGLISQMEILIVLCKYLAEQRKRWKEFSQI